MWFFQRRPDVSRLKGKRNVKGLIKATSYKVGSTEFKDTWVRRDAAEALGEIGDPQAVDPLITALGDTEEYVRRAAARALGQIGDARSVGPLVATLKDREHGVRKAAVGALFKLGWKPDKSEAGAIYYVMREQWRKCVSIGAPAVKLLIDAFQREPWGSGAETAKEICQVLAQIGTPAVEPLVAAFEEVQGKIRGRTGQMWADIERCDVLAETLGQIGDVRAAEPLIATFRRGWASASWWAAVEALGAIGAPAVPMLVAALNDSDQRVRQNAAKAIGLIREPHVLEPLASMLGDRDASVRKAAVGALGSAGTAKAVQPLSAALRDRDASVRKAAVEALGSTGSAKAVEPLSAALGDAEVPVRLEAVRSLVRVRSRRVVEPLVAALQDQDSGVRELAAETLGRLGDDRAVAGLIACLDDEDGSVRWNATQALAQLGAPEAVEPLIACLKADLWHTRKVAAQALLGLYEAGMPSEPAKAAILAQRSAITRQHQDSYGCLGDHSDDGGIGVSFPL